VVILSSKPWDTSAGVVIARKAGELVVGTDGSRQRPTSMSTIAVAPPTLSEMLAVIG